MRIACGRLDLRVTEQAPDHRQALPERQRPRRVRVSAIVEPRVLQPRALADEIPRVVQVAHRLALDLARDDMRVAGDARHRRQHRRRLRRQRNRPRAGLAIGQPQLVRLEVHLAPAQVQDLALVAPGQQQANRRDRMDRDSLAALRLVQHPPEAAELPVGEKPLAGALAELHHPPARIARLRDPAPVLGRVVDARQHVDRPIRRHRSFAQPVVQLRHLRMAHAKRRRLLAGDDPGVALDARDAGEHPLHRRRQRQPKKDIWLRPLRKDWRLTLNR